MRAIEANGGWIMPDDKDKSGHGADFARALAQLSQIGITIISCIATGILIGWFLDRLFGTTPWILLVFVFLGIAAAFRSIFDFAKKQ